MTLRTPAELGAAVRARRREAGLDQRQLAERAGVSRKWIIALEKGSAGATIGLILRTLRVLNLSLATVAERAAPASRSSRDIDIDAIVAAGRKKRE